MNTFLILPLSLFAASTAAATHPVKINGSTTVNLPVAEAAEILRAEQNMTIQVDTQGGSAGGLSALADGRTHVAMVSRELTDADRERFPNVAFKPVRIGEDAVALVVSRDVWEGGIKSLSKPQVKAIYEGRIKTWQELGGPDRRIAFFNKEPGRGTWEVFATWLYGHARDAPRASFPEVGGNEETRSKVGTTRGALSQLSSSWADGEKVFALGLDDGAGNPIAPVKENIAAGRYPMARPLYVVTNGEPAGGVKTLVEFLLSDRGQQLVRKHGYLALADLVP